MNQRNVDALAEILRRGGSAYVWPDRTLDVVDFAEFLASSGVLVPSALTPEQIRDLRCIDESTLDEPGQVLEKIAKGEA